MIELDKLSVNIPDDIEQPGPVSTEMAVIAASTNKNKKANSILKEFKKK